jgi:hypothetical protein
MLKFNPRHIRFELIDPNSVYILTLKKKRNNSKNKN